MINNLEAIRREVYLQLKYPHIKVHITTDISPPVKNMIEHELYYKENGSYPPNDIDFCVPEKLSDRAYEIAERLLK